jgi:hypothetical protein
MIKIKFHIKNIKFSNEKDKILKFKISQSKIFKKTQNE